MTNEIKWTRDSLRCSKGFRLRSMRGDYQITVTPEVIPEAVLSIGSLRRVYGSDCSDDAVERLKALAQKIEDAIHEHEQSVVGRTR